MMDIQQLIESGDLELYVCGALPATRAQEIAAISKQHPQVLEEIISIENAYQRLAAGLAPAHDDKTYDRLEAIIGANKNNNTRSSWSPIIGWAAAGLLLIASGYLFNANNNAQDQLVQTEQQKEFLETENEQIESLNTQYASTLDVLADPATVKVNLGGQAGFESSNAVAFYNNEQNVTYVDIKGLPEVPENMVYQLWSLTLDPLTPTSLGTLPTDKESYNQLIKINNAFDTEAFGITLEETGGAATPTMERLYTLGVLDKG
ncbi:MAG: anti-sigma factor [Nonlabens sp.]|uniref:anti-sigma factor n=1 Tax=Nonlabens sp. TaxID=1888209 RepID=UPI003EF658DF